MENNESYCQNRKQSFYNRINISVTWIKFMWQYLSIYMNKWYRKKIPFKLPTFCHFIYVPVSSCQRWKHEQISSYRNKILLSKAGKSHWFGQNLKSGIISHISGWHKAKICTPPWSYPKFRNTRTTFENNPPLYA